MSPGSLGDKTPASGDKRSSCFWSESEASYCHEGHCRAVDVCFLYFGKGDSISSHVSPMSVTAGGASVVVPPNSIMRFRSSSNASP